MYNDDIYLEYNKAHSFAFKNLVFYKTFAILILFLLIHQIINYLKGNPVDLNEIILLPTFLICIFFIFVYPFFLPIHYSLNKYKNLYILDNTIQINQTKYNIPELEFSEITINVPRLPLSWTYLKIKKDKKVVGNFIFSINGNTFLGVSATAIIKILNMKKEGINKDFNTFLFNEIKEQKEFDGHANILKYLVAFPLIIIFFFFFAIR